MFTIFFVLAMTALLVYQNMQASKQRALEAEKRKEEDEKMPKVAVDRDFISRLSRDGAHVPADIGSISRILHQWDPKPAGSDFAEGDWDEISKAIVEQLRKDVNAEKVAKALKQAYTRKFLTDAKDVDGIANYIVNWWRAYILA